MNSVNASHKPSIKWGAIVGWGIFAALGGLGCVIMPPYLFPEANVRPSYGQPLVPWFSSAYANLRFVPTEISMFVVGAILGLTQTRWWPLSCCLTVSLPVLLNGINFLHDVIIDPTSHNLWPFEFAILIFLGLPALGAGFLGSLARRSLQRSRTKS